MTDAALDVVAVLLPVLVEEDTIELLIAVVLGDAEELKDDTEELRDDIEPLLTTDVEDPTAELAELLTVVEVTDANVLAGEEELLVYTYVLTVAV